MTILVVDSQCHSVRFNMFSGILYNIIWSYKTHVTIWYVIRKSPYFPRSWDGNQVPSMNSAIRRSLGWDSYWFDGVVCMFFYLLGYYMKHVWLRSSIVYMLETWIWCFFVSIWDFLTLCPGWSQIHGLSHDPAEIEVNSTSSTCLFWEFSLRVDTLESWKHKLRMTDLGHFAESLVPSKCATPSTTPLYRRRRRVPWSELWSTTGRDQRHVSFYFLSEEWERPISGLWWTPCHKPVPFGDYFSKSI